MRGRAAAIGLVLVAACQSPGDRREGLRPATRAGATEVLVELVEGPSSERERRTDVRFRVEVPPNHHGYLDAGDDGFFIPFAFSFDSDGVIALSRPTGARDDEVRATVLRGEGEFTFRLHAGGKASEATVRYQICNDSTGVCYSPSSVVVPLPGS